MVVQGRVRVTDAGANGTERTLAVFRPGMVFGEVAAVGGGPQIADAITEEATAVLRLD